MSATEHEHRVSSLELVFDLVFVFAITQVTSFLVHDPTWGGALRAMLVLAAVWWAWSTYAWLTSAADLDEGGVRLALLAAMGAMLGVALAVPGAFAGDAVLFGVAYLLVRALHFVLLWLVARDNPDRRGVLLRFAPTAAVGASLILVAGFLGSGARVAVWMIALAVDYLGPTVIVAAVSTPIVAGEAVGRREHRARIRNAERELALGERP